MNTPKHATDSEIDALFELLPEVAHDPFEQRRKNERCPLTTVETELQPEIKVAHNG